MPDDGSRHEDHRETSCPFCTGDIADHIVERIMVSASRQGPAMSADEFKAWLAILPGPLR
jgi:hypothetical protein